MGRGFLPPVHAPEVLDLVDDRVEVVVEEVHRVLSVATVVELVCMLAHGTVCVVTGAIAFHVAITWTPHVHVAPGIAHLHTAHTRTHACTHACAHTHARTHTHTLRIDSHIE